MSSESNEQPQEIITPSLQDLVLAIDDFHKNLNVAWNWSRYGTAFSRHLSNQKDGIPCLPIEALEKSQSERLRIAYRAYHVLVISDLSIACKQMLAIGVVSPPHEMFLVQESAKAIWRYSHSFHLIDPPVKLGAQYPPDVTEDLKSDGKLFKEALASLNRQKKRLITCIRLLSDEQSQGNFGDIKTLEEKSEYPSGIITFERLTIDLQAKEIRLGAEVFPTKSAEAISLLCAAVSAMQNRSKATTVKEKEGWFSGAKVCNYFSGKSIQQSRAAETLNKLIPKLIDHNVNDGFRLVLKTVSDMS